MKLVHITTVPMSLMFLRGQTRYMQDRGLDLHAITSPGEGLRLFGLQENIATHAVELPRRITPVQDVKSVWRLREVIRRIRPHIVHGHTPKGGLLGMISARLARVPVRVYHMRGLPYMTATGRKRTLLKATEWLSCLLADRVFCVSHSIRKVAITDGIVPAEKIVVFGGGSGNGVDSDVRFNPERYAASDVRAKRAELSIPEKAPVVLFVGRIVRDKGVEELSRAWSDIRELFPDARIVVAGPRESQDPASDEAMISLIEDKRAILTGEVDDAGILYALADLVVLPTYREGFPNVPLEAAAMGVPVVATEIPGCIDAVDDGVTGTLVPPRDSEALCGAIRQYLEEPELRQRHGKAGRARVLSDFRQELIWEGIYQEYCTLLRSRGLPVPEVPQEKSLRKYA